MKRIIQSFVLTSLVVTSCSNLYAAISGTTYNSCYAAGEKAFALSDYVLAAENFAEALKFRPDDLRSRLKYAQTLYSLDKYTESSEQLQRVLQNSPNNIIARICLAENYIKLDKKEAAKEQLDWILKIQPNHQKAKSLLVNIGNAISDDNENASVPAEKAADSDSFEKEKLTALPAAEEKVEVQGELNVVEPNNAELLDNTDNTENNNLVENEKSSILSDSDDSIKFTPYIAGENKKTRNDNKAIKPKMPLARANIENTDMKSFFNEAKESFIVNIEKARFEIEQGDLKSAEKTIEIANKLAKNTKNGRNMLEVQIFKSLIYIYKCEFQQFGKHLMTLKPVLSTETYQSFLDIYSKADELKTEEDKKRLAAGVAVGAGHYALAASLLKPVFEKNPDDLVLYSMLSEAELNSFDYEGAELTFKKYAETNPECAEAQFNMARFYLTADYQPEMARKYAKLASELNPEDARCQIIMALTDYSEGKIDEGIKTIKEILPSLEDSSMKAICQRLIQDGEKASKDSKKNFISMLALPGSKFADLSTLKFSGEDDLLAGSYFSAMKKFEKADEKVEIGRVYLGLASTLTSANETEMASVAAGYGLKYIREDVSRGKNIARASLYTALYDYERGDKESAMASIDLGLNCKDLDYSTYNKLISLYESL